MDLTTISADHLQTLFESVGAMNSSLEFDDVLNAVMDAVMRVTKAQRGYLMVSDERGVLEVRVARGMDGEKLADAQAYSRTIVNQVIETRQVLLTNNAQDDGRYVPGESIVIRGLRAILCAPMLVKDRLIGVVYVDTSIRSGAFTEADLELLTAVAGQAGVAIENARLYGIAVEKGRLERELQMAREIQESLLPRRIPQLRGYDIAARWQSAREVAGDFYDVFALSDGSVGLVIADVSDKGAPAALFMASARSMIRTHALAGFSSLDTLSRANDLIADDSDNGMFVTTYYSVFHENGISEHINAGHNPPLLYRRAAHQMFTMPRGGRAIGWFPNNPLQKVDVTLSAGDVLLYYTDGITDAENGSGEAFGEERLMRTFMASATRNPQAVVELLIGEVYRFCDGAAPFDDITLCVVRYRGD